MARQHRVEVRLNSKEREILGEYADRFGMTHSEAVRRLIHQLIDKCQCSQEGEEKQ